MVARAAQELLPEEPGKSASQRRRRRKRRKKKTKKRTEEEEQEGERRRRRNVGKEGDRNREVKADRYSRAIQALAHQPTGQVLSLSLSLSLALALSLSLFRLAARQP
jgi:hypothetical protein